MKKTWTIKGWKVAKNECVFEGIREDGAKVQAWSMAGVATQIEMVERMGYAEFRELCAQMDRS